VDISVSMKFKRTNDVSFRAFTLTQSNENDTENSSSPNVNFSMFGSTIDIVKVLNGIEQQMRLELLLAAFIQCEEILKVSVFK
jgi:hypothetical protein